MATETVKTKLEKRKDHAFGKDVYLLGRDEYGDLIWLEAPSWDCGWYWGFGYVEVYTNQKHPSRSRDIQSHSHFDGLVGFKTEKGNYVHHLNESPKIQETVLTDRESWELADLMKTFYTLKEAASIYHNGNSHVSSSALSLKNADIAKQINEVDIPRVTARVLEILTPQAGN